MPSALAFALLVVAAFPPTPVGAHKAERGEGIAGSVHHDVVARNLTFEPDVLHVRSGEHVNFTNLENRLHSFTAVNSSFDSGTLHPGTRFDWKADLPPGNYTYACKFVPTMVGVIAVGDPHPPNTPPVAAITSPGDGEVVSGKLLIEGTADDPDKDWFRVRVRVNDGPWRYVVAGWTWSIEWDSRVVGNGPVSLEAVTEDRWGEESTSARIVVEVKNGKAEPEGAPAVVITSPLPDSRVSGEVTVEGIASGSRPDVNITVKVRIDRGAWKEIYGQQHWSWTWDTRTVKDGPHAIEAIATDGKRNSPSSRVTVLVFNAGTSQITLSILGPQERAKASGVVEIRGQAEDPEGQPLRVHVRVDAGEWKPADGRSPWTYYWNSSLVGNGPHVIEAIARASNRASVTAKVTLFADNGEALDRPTVEITVPAANERLAGRVLLQGKASSVAGTPLSVEVRVDDGPWDNATWTTVWGYSLDTRALTNGVHAFEARSFDGRAHSDVATVRFLVANAPDEIGRGNETPPAPPPLRKKVPPVAESGFFAPGPGVLASLVALAALAAIAARRRRGRA